LQQAVDKREAPGSPGALFVAGDFVGGIVERKKLKEQHECALRRSRAADHE